MSSLPQRVASCEQCPRLRKHCRQVALTRRKAYATETYWGKPVPGLGTPKTASLWIVGLAPAAHGANRTGRIFTGDRSGDWLYKALNEHGFANQPQSTHAQDGLKLHETYISCVVRCAPPDNKPTPSEIDRCFPYLEEELTQLKHLKAIVVLGQIAWQGVWRLLQAASLATPGTRPKFGHGHRIELPSGLCVIQSYHPSQQNTFTGRLTWPMWSGIFEQARSILRQP